MKNHWNYNKAYSKAYKHYSHDARFDVGLHRNKYIKKNNSGSKAFTKFNRDEKKLVHPAFFNRQSRAAFNSTGDQVASHQSSFFASTDKKKTWWHDQKKYSNFSAKHYVKKKPYAVLRNDARRVRRFYDTKITKGNNNARIYNQRHEVSKGWRRYKYFNAAAGSRGNRGPKKFPYQLKNFRNFYKTPRLSLPYGNAKYRSRRYIPGKYKRGKFRFIASNPKFRKSRQLQKGSRFKTWKTCKKPFWKRKSFKFIKLYNLIFLNTFKAYARRRLKMRKMRLKKITGFDRRGRKRRKRFFGKRFWYEYFRRNKVKFWFRNKIALRFAWMTRYSCFSHNKAAKFVWKIRRRTPALLRFWRRYEFTLDRYILWWQIAPRLTQNSLEFSRRVIKNGYVYVNFVPELLPSYIIKLGDCIFVLKQFRRELHKSYFTAKLSKPFYSLFRRGYRLRCITRFQPRYLFKKKFMFFLKRYKMLQRLSHWNKAYFLYFRYFMERSYKYRIFVNLHAMSWFTLIFSTIGKLYYPITYYFINSFVNRRYG